MNSKDVGLPRLIDRLAIALALQAMAATSLSRAGRNDRAVSSEDVILPLLRDLYGWPSLRNGNVDDPQTSGYDLIADGSKIAVQVTVQHEEVAKVRKSLDAFMKSRPDDSYRALYVCFLKPERVDRRALQNVIAPEGIDFSQDVHVIERHNIVARAGKVGVSRLSELVEELEKGVGIRQRYEYSVDAIAFSNDLVLTLLRGFQPEYGGGLDQKAWSSAGDLLHTYNRASWVARLRGAGRRASDAFASEAAVAIEAVRQFCTAGSDEPDLQHNAIKAWKALDIAQSNLRDYAPGSES
ncbi:SMEK domain-containing protein [Rhizobium leguminosarum]|uniref:SMEK domain-containing protein n=1 Tax=Rhizobium leguminosarum TaxID=384 RepID=UPI001C95F6B0|nr:SMEK domain-containing protein [Rhizobium leguminosarum]MBY5422311.1 SMEK domain-containing protein [Rhizobium leguminosarum]